MLKFAIAIYFLMVLSFCVESHKPLKVSLLEPDTLVIDSIENDWKDTLETDSVECDWDDTLVIVGGK